MNITKLTKQESWECAVWKCCRLFDDYWYFCSLHPSVCLSLCLSVHLFISVCLHVFQVEVARAYR